ncbi:protein NYNRIN-like [Grus japonensis]|uniref:ribonuclease H n=1 Tax=Grus japonensis TaxID=30415 RepID=A0ABC9YK68_GRUJA
MALKGQEPDKNLEKDCSACDNGKRCLKREFEDDDVELLVAPRRRLGNDQRDQNLEANNASAPPVEGEAEGFSPIAGRTRGRRGGDGLTVLQAPLRQAVGNEGPVMVKVPFSITDLRAWKETAGTYRDDPERVDQWRDLLSKLDAQIIFKDGEIRLLIPESKAIEARVFMLQDSSKEEQIPEVVDNAVTPLVWASEVPGRSKLAEPVKVTLKPGAKPVRQKQYPIKWEARKGLEELITKFLEYGLLVECESEYNTPILPVKKSGGKEYRLVQDLRAINQIVQDIHPVVANPYTLLTSLKEEHKWFTVLDLKDAFFCIPLDAKSQSIFAFEWESPGTGRKMQLTWTVLPQGFKNSPTLFGNQLVKELEMWKKQNPGEGILLQYVDDILIAAESKGTCFEMTISLLNFLGQGGYRVSRNKAQIGKEAVIYLGFEISQGQRQLGNERKEAICQIPEPNSPKELRAFLGMIGWCRLWILNYGLYVKPLYEALKESKDRYLIWTPECHKSFKELKKALMTAPALGLPDLTKPFELFVHERQHLALGVLAQRLGSWKRPVGYFSKQLDTVSKGWPGCLRAVAATVLLIQEARKLTMGQKIVVYVPHMVITVLEQKGGHWLSPSRMLKYQVVLLEQDDVELKTAAIVNPAMFLTTENPTEKLEHDCLITIEQVYSSRPDLKDEPLKDPDLELFMDGSSFVQEGRRIAGYAVVTTDKVLESGTLPANTSAQKAELVALKQALRMAEGKRVNIWTDSKYAFGVIHAHGAIWKERGLLSAQGSPIKYKEEVLQLLQEVQKPKEVAVMHCKAHQFGQTAINIGNRLADKAAKEAAERGEVEGTFPGTVNNLYRNQGRRSGALDSLHSSKEGTARSVDIYARGTFET